MGGLSGAPSMVRLEHLRPWAGTVRDWGRRLAERMRWGSLGVDSMGREGERSRAFGLGSLGPCSNERSRNEGISFGSNRKVEQSAPDHSPISNVSIAIRRIVFDTAGPASTGCRFTRTIAVRIIRDTIEGYPPLHRGGASLAELSAI